jgi:hypothetical protein
LLEALFPGRIDLGLARGLPDGNAGPALLDGRPSPGDTAAHGRRTDEPIWRRYCATRSCSTRQTQLSWGLPGFIATDEQLDVASGLAECIGALLALHAVAPSARPVHTAVACAEHLLKKRGSWRTASAG